MKRCASVWSTGTCRADERLAFRDTPNNTSDPTDPTETKRIITTKWLSTHTHLHTHKFAFYAQRGHPSPNLGPLSHPFRRMHPNTRHACGAPIMRLQRTRPHQASAPSLSCPIHPRQALMPLRHVRRDHLQGKGNTTTN